MFYNSFPPYLSRSFGWIFHTIHYWKENHFFLGLLKRGCRLTSYASFFHPFSVSLDCRSLPPYRCEKKESIHILHVTVESYISSRGLLYQIIISTASASWLPSFVRTSNSKKKCRIPPPQKADIARELTKKRDFSPSELHKLYFIIFFRHFTKKPVCHNIEKKHFFRSSTRNKTQTKCFGKWGIRDMRGTYRAYQHMWKKKHFNWQSPNPWHSLHVVYVDQKKRQSFFLLLKNSHNRHHHRAFYLAVLNAMQYIWIWADVIRTLLRSENATNQKHLFISF